MSPLPKTCTTMKKDKTGKDEINYKALGAGSNNQNGNLRWYSPLGVDPPPPQRLHYLDTFFPPFFFDGCPVGRLYGHQVAWSRRRAATRFGIASATARVDTLGTHCRSDPIWGLPDSLSPVTSAAGARRCGRDVACERRAAQAG